MTKLRRCGPKTLTPRPFTSCSSCGWRCSSSNRPSRIPELDGRDLLAETRHFWLERPDGEVICTLRLMEEHAGGEKAFRIGRLCTKRSARGQGHTTRLLRAALAEVGDYPCRINAQTYLADMYAQHGFVRDGDDFVDDGVPHVPMLRPGSGLAEQP